MKNFIRIIVWTLVALTIQQSIFLYIENVYLDTDVQIKAEKVEEKEDLKSDNANCINLKDGIDKVSVSSDGRFVAYLDNDKLKILDSNNNVENEFKSEDEGQVVFFKWLTNENNMIVIQKIQNNGQSYYQPVSYNAKKCEARQLADYNLNELKIPIEDENDKIENVVFSTASSTLYIKIKKDNGLSDLYYTNIMNQLSRVRHNKEIGNIVVPTTSTNPVMEMGNSITILNSSDNISIPNVEITKILGTDINDNVYFGSEVDGKITKIYYTTLDDKNLKWNSVNLQKSVNEEDIMVDYSGKVYVNDSETNTITEIMGNSSIKYEGVVIQPYSKGVITKVGNKLIKNEVEDKRILINK